MKKRLSLLMAVLMVASLLPMSAFAAGKPQASTNRNVTTADKDRQVTVAFDFEKTTTVTKLAQGLLELKLSDNGAKFAEGKKIKVEWSNAADKIKVNDTEASADGQAVQVDPSSDSLAYINLTEATGKDDTLTLGAAKETLKFTFNVDFSGVDTSKDNGVVYLKVTDNTNPAADEDFVDSQNVRIATVTEESASDLAITVKDEEKAVSFDGGELSRFEIKNFKNMKDEKKPEGTPAIDEEKPGTKADYLVVSIDDDNLKFDSAKIFIDGKSVASGTDYDITDGQIVFKEGKVDKNTKVVTIIPTVSVGRKATEGTVRITAAAMYKEGIYKAVATNWTSPTFAETSTKTRMSERATIGKVVDYNVTMTVVEKGKKEIPSVWGGEEAEVTVTLKGPKGSILNRNIDFKVDGADVVYSIGGNLAGTEGKDADKKPTGLFEDAEFYVTAAADRTEVKFNLKIKTNADKDGVATITAAQRGWEVKADLAKITPKFTVKTDLSPVKKGEAKETANLVITEAKAGLLARGDKLVLEFDTRREYTEFTTKDLKVEATNGMTFGTPEWVNAKGTDKRFVAIEIPVKKDSYKEAAVITVSGLKVRVDGSSTDDTVKLAVKLNGGKVAAPEYIKVVKEYALESITAVFTIGQTQYTKNGQAMTAASAPYIKNGRTMLPIRAVSESLGLNVQWNGATKTATFSDATKVAAVTIGADKMYVQGTPIPLAGKAELINGTTFVEMRGISTAFGVQIDWDAAAKTVTVSK